MVNYPSRDAIRQNVDITYHALCSHIAKDLNKFIKRHIFSYLDEMKGLSLRELDVLMCVAYFDDPITAADIAATIRFDPATVSRAAQRLLDSEMLEKIENYEDSRSALLCLTDSGANIANAFRRRSQEALAAAEQYLTTALSEIEKEELLRLLLKMRKRSVEFSDLKTQDILRN